ncbi:hypothetical protein OH809_39360 [Streptomyces sp. NBC_00873]|uniref:hypothetical protein n=1 Tax=unclassified Streptomyces TaxID=2593676 RepID=UPI003870C5A3|nr:hypothetical protein OH809_39360 [Streptomyces sp. NBC_00873]WTA41969.1 hypothetical protein OH821_04335 [Streptomyces sp. NBC_00842]
MTTVPETSVPDDPTVPTEDAELGAVPDDDDAGDREAVTVYSAELRWQEGRYLLVVHDHLRGSVQATRVARKAVDKMPTYLAMLGRPRH